jgi:curved DNA-binding protein CbpA
MGRGTGAGSTAQGCPFHLREHLDVLGLKWPCTLEEVKKAYWAGAMKHHPDRGGKADDFVKLKTASEALKAALGG